MNKVIKLKINDKVFEFERAMFEERFTENGIGKLKDIELTKNPLVKSSLGMVLTMMGIKKPKEFEEMDNIEFIARVAVTSILDTLESYTVELEGKEVVEEVKADE